MIIASLLYGRLCESKYMKTYTDDKLFNRNCPKGESNFIIIIIKSCYIV